VGEDERLHMSKEMNPEGEPNEPVDPVFDHLANAMDGNSPEAFEYRRDLCLILAGKLKSEFGVEGLCQMLSAIDVTAGWTSDILLESSDIDDVLFAEYGIFVENSISVAQKTVAMKKFQKSLWSSRRRYAKLMAAELFGNLQKK